ncbi:uncharacterized protein LOC126902887 isoform X5 [Daktulosphaira vitifoliae]|uniref:uncharacterized protein LOC126902887 isoform X5 n=1 Tax=Daktulosphaira vitifoliae TaxID=58002 RepID=UPI0021A9EB1D|nr:uncharacterized protein LOC126902887 isoform X5 [Daktulosphaira vitifoliae]
MEISDGYKTSYRIAHRYMPIIAFESNVSPLAFEKELLPNSPKLKHWNYDTSTKVNFTYKSDTMDPIQKPMKVTLNKQEYMMPQCEKLWSEPLKPIYIPPTEYNNKFIHPEKMVGIIKLPIPYSCVQSKLTNLKEICTMKSPKTNKSISIPLLVPYTSTHKLAYIDKNFVIKNNFNKKNTKRTLLVNELYNNKPIINHQTTLRILPNTMKKIPHNAHKTEMTDAYKKPINSLINYENTFEIPVSVSHNSALAQILSVPEMYTTEYSKIGG